MKECGEERVKSRLLCLMPRLLTSVHCSSIHTVSSLHPTMLRLLPYKHELVSYKQAARQVCRCLESLKGFWRHRARLVWGAMQAPLWINKATIVKGV